MKKLLMAMGIAGIILAGCGSDEAASDEKEKETVTEEQPAAQETEAPKEEEQTKTDDPEETGEFYEEGFGHVKTVGVGYSEELGIDGSDKPVKPFEMGPMILSINGVAVVDIEPDEDVKELFFEGQDKVRAIITDMKAENTSDDDITFHPNQAIVTTDTGEQVESAMGLMGEAGGDFLGKVTKEGQTFWFLKNTDQDINKLTFIISPPMSTDSWEDIGEEKRIEVEVLTWEEAKEKDAQ